MADENATQFFNWPTSKQIDIPYTSPPKESNPVFRGTPLAIGAPLVESLSFVSKFLYNNAGFNKLRTIKALDDVEHRYDPTVIPLHPSASTPIPNYTDPALLRPLETKSDGPPLFYSVRDYHEAYKSGKLTPLAVVNKLLPLVRRDATPRSSHATAFLSSQVAIITAAAEASTARWAAGKPLGVLDGVPVAVKDEIDLKGYEKTFGSKKVFEKSSAATSWCVAKWEEEGAIVIGKTNMHEIGMDTTNNNPTHGTPLNPYNDKYYTGGSSGGSGYAVGAGLVPFALGCDGGGSIRIPSSYCGIYGLKPTHDRVSSSPTPALAGTNTVCGPMAVDMASLEVAYRVMATPDPSSRHSAMFPAPRPLDAPRQKVLGIYKPWFDRADEPVRKLCQAAIDHYKANLGYEVIDIAIPLIHEGQSAHAITILSEAVSGFPNPTYLQPANRVLISVASNCPTSDFLQAQRVRQLLMAHLAYLFTQHPGLIIVTPTTPNAGWAITGGAADLKCGLTDGDKTTRTMEYIWLSNFTGCPSITMPAGYVKPEMGEGDVPIGLMGMNIWGGEEALIEWGFEGEKYLLDVLEGGRLKPSAWTDVLDINGSVDSAAAAPAPSAVAPASEKGS